MQTYFTADLHLGHENVIRYDNRPFSCAQEMDSVIIENWNSRVRKCDTVYVLGDVSWHREAETVSILESLNGRKILVKGNHDKLSRKVQKMFDEVCDYKEIRLNEKYVTLCHYPIPFFNRQHSGAYMFYGHVHNSKEWAMIEQHKYNLETKGIPCRMFNAGVMCHNYYPVTFSELTDHI